MKPIVHVPHNVLTTPAQPITVFDKKLTNLIKTMVGTLIATKNPKGVGLAAPQIGEPYRVFITRPRENSKIRVFINPEIMKFSEELTDGVPERDNKLEGCLSIPKIWGRVKREKAVTLKYLDESGVKHKDAFEGFLATIVQHETDHVNGILYTQRVLEQSGKLYQTTKDAEGKEILEELSLP
jgi:peptide deformylase